MDSLVPCYASRVKGRAEVWRARLAEEPYLDGRLAEAAAPVPDLPTSKSYDAAKVWSAYADGRAYIAPTPLQEVVAVILRERGALTAAAAEACELSADCADEALREVCAAIVAMDGGKTDAAAALTVDARRVCAHLDAGGLRVPRDLGVIPAEAMRAFVQRAEVASGDNESE